jgi:hypothetical protein
VIGSDERRRPIMAGWQPSAAASRRALPPAVPADGLDPSRALLPGAWHRLDAKEVSPEELELFRMSSRATVKGFGGTPLWR